MNDCLIISLEPDRILAATVAADQGRWTVRERAVKDVSAAEASPNLLASLVAELAQRLGVKKNTPTALAIDSRRFSWQLLPEPQVKRRFRRQVLASAFEERSSTPLEKLHLVIEPHAVQDESLVLAVDQQWLSQLLDELERLGLEIDLAVPDTMIMAHLAANRPVADAVQPATPLVLARRNQKTCLLALDDGRLSGWQCYRDASAAEADAPRWAVAGGLPEAQSVAEITVADEALLVALAEQLNLQNQTGNVCTGRFSSGRMRRWLYRHATAALFLAAAIMLVLSVPLFHDAAASRNVVAQTVTAEQEAWQTIAPGQPLPPALVAKLEFDVTRLKALAGESPDAPAYQSARILLERVLAALPLGTRLDVSEMRVDQRDLTIRGETNSHADAERIAKAVDGVPGLSCPLPRSDVLGAGRVTFVIYASLTATGEEASRAKGR